MSRTIFGFAIVAIFLFSAPVLGAREVPSGVDGIGPHLAFAPREARPTKSDYLLLFLIGTATRPKFYLDFAEHARKSGYYVLVLNYPVRLSSLDCRPVDSAAYQERIVFGRGGRVKCFSQGFAHGDPERYVNEPGRQGSIRALAARALSQLGWGAFTRGFLTRTLNNERVVLAGHSKGAGHAAYYAIREGGFRRVLLFSGPPACELPGETPGSFYKEADKAGLLRKCEPAAWLRGSSKQDRSRFYAVIPKYDAITIAPNLWRSACHAMGRPEADCASGNSAQKSFRAAELSDVMGLSRSIKRVMSHRSRVYEIRDRGPRVDVNGCWKRLVERKSRRDLAPCAAFFAVHNMAIMNRARVNDGMRGQLWFFLLPPAAKIDRIEDR